MSVMIAAQLQTGTIFGDTANQEYVYMPGSEVGLVDPLCVLETASTRQDIPLKQAVNLVLRLSLKPTSHPLLGTSSC